MTNPAPSSCPHCGKPVPDRARLCPNCGATVPPLPDLNNKARSTLVEPFVLWTGSKKGDIAAGIALGVFTPILICALLIVPAIFGLVSLPFLLSIPIGLGVLVWITSALKRKHHVAGDAMQKTLFGWLILIGLTLLGLFVACLVGGITI